MKYLITLMLLVFTIAFSACKSFTECSNISNSEAMLLVDVSDPKLYQVIRQDITDNFGSFMQRSKLGLIEPCQRFTLRVAPLGAQESLEMSEQSIQVTSKRQSIKDQQSQASPAPILNMLKTKLTEYEKLSQDKETTSGSTLANTLLKAMLQANPASDLTVVMMTDGIENNGYLNLYKKVPSDEEVPKLLNSLIDAKILEKWDHFLEEGAAPKVIMVLKPATSASAKVNIRAVKNYWAALFKALKLSNVEFADNLNNINP